MSFSAGPLGLGGLGEGGEPPTAGEAARLCSEAARADGRAQKDRLARLSPANSINFPRSAEVQG